MNVTDLMIDREVPTGTIDGSNQVFNLVKPPDPVESLQLVLNGILQTVGEDYSIVDVKITFVSAPPTGSILFVDYRYSLIVISTSKIGDVDGSALNNDEDWTNDTAANVAQATADGKIVTFLQDEPPTAEGAGDLWIDTNDGNKLYRWSGSAWVEVQDSDIAQAIVDAATAQSTADSKTDDTAADAAQATADGKVVTFLQDEPPTAEGAGDLWIDTNDGNKLYRWSGSAWVEVQDDDIAQAITNAATAQSTADSKTDDTAADAAQATADSKTDDTAADAAQATADGKIVTFFQSEAPTAEGVGDLWMDTNDGNKLYRWNGSTWAEIQDDDIAQALVDASTAQSTADSKTDDTAADAAQATADSKIITFIQDSEPTAEGAGDLWIDTNDFNKLYRWSGSAWVFAGVGSLGPEFYFGEFERHDLSLESLDGWDTGGGLSLWVGTLELDTGTTLNTTKYANAETWEGVDFADKMLSQWRFRLTSASNVTLYIYTGYAYFGDPDGQAFGFKIVNGALYAYWQAGPLEDSTEYTQLISGITTTNYHTYRVEYDPGNSIKFYVDGVLKHTATTNLPVTTWGTGAFCGLQIKNTAAASKKVLLNQVYFTAVN